VSHRVALARARGDAAVAAQSWDDRPGVEETSVIQIRAGREVPANRAHRPETIHERPLEDR
jgi:hypothetical protein